MEFYFDEEKANKPINFINKFCLLNDGIKRGKPATVLPFWSEIIQQLYGWQRHATDENDIYANTRKYRKATIFTPKKVGKSTTISFLSLYGIFEEPGAQVYVLSASLETAQEIWKNATFAIEHSIALSNRLKIRRSGKTGWIEDKKNGGKLEVIAGSSKTASSGQHASMVVFDELGLIRDQTAWDMFLYAGAARRQPLHISISTLFYDRHSLWWNEWLQVQKLLKDPSLDPHHFAYYLGVPESVDWQNSDNWWPHLPHIDQTVSKQFYLEQWQACQTNPSKLPEFRVKMLNQEVELLTTWISEPNWQQCKFEFDESFFFDKKTVIGVDPGDKFAAYCLVCEHEGKIYVLPKFFVPKKVAEDQERQVKTPYSEWQKSKFVTITSGEVTDTIQLRNSILEDYKKLKCVELAFDTRFLADSQILEQHGVNITQVPTSFDVLGDTTVEFERLVNRGDLRHNGNHCTDWQIKGCQVKTDNSNRQRLLIDRDKSTARYDSISALLSALHRILNNRPAQSTGIRFF